MARDTVPAALTYMLSVARMAIPVVGATRGARYPMITRTLGGLDGPEGDRTMRTKISTARTECESDEQRPDAIYDFVPPDDACAPPHDRVASDALAWRGGGEP